MHLANSVASNNPIEDYHSEHESKDGLVVGIYDGHSGPQCAATVSKVLSSYVQRELNIISSGSDGLKPKDKVIDGIKDAFVKLDNDITLGSLLLDSPSTSNSWLSWNPFYKRTDYAQVLKGIRTAAAGSCAIIAFLQGDEVYVACTGDCRAVIGRNLGYESQYEALELSKDQTATDPTEFSRLCEEHPGEDATVVVRGRVLGGLMPSRAFGTFLILMIVLNITLGDARYKWPLSVLEVVSPVLGRRIPPNYHTPPYVTAKPEVSYYKRDKSDEFLILACDGLWDFMSSKTAVKVVKEMMDKGYDENYATALIQAGISGYGSGGSILDKERIQHSLSIPAPKCRRFRDDMSVNVLFFPTSNVSIGKMEQSKVVDSVPPFPPTQSPQLYGWIGYLKNLNKPKSPTSTPPLTKSKL